MKFISRLKERLEHRAQVQSEKTESSLEFANVQPAVQPSRITDLKNSVAEFVDKLGDMKDTILSPEELYNQRITICRECEFFREQSVTCSKCGCYMQLKTRLTGANCPVGKW